MLINEFFTFMLNRELVRLRRNAGHPRPAWTADPILREYKFTNVKREHDRTTRLLKEEFYDKVEYDCAERTSEVLLNAAIFRYFGTIEMARALGWTSFPTDKSALRKHITDTAIQRFKDKETVFTGAYIIPNCGDSRPKHEVVADTLLGIYDVILNWNNNIPTSWQKICEGLNVVNGVGSFMAKEVVLDYLLATGTPTDWTTWTPVGPGARRGAARVHSDTGALVGPMGERQALEFIRTLWSYRTEHWPTYILLDNQNNLDLLFDEEPADDEHRGKWTKMVDLDLTDIQFQLCEFDKYMRAKLGEGRPKKKFVPTIE